MLAITAAELISAGEHLTQPMVLVEEGRIVAIHSRLSHELPAAAEHRDFAGAVLAPGLVDLHIHGAAGYDVMEGSDDGLERMAHYLAAHGVGSFLATTVTSPADVLLASVETLAAQIERWEERGLARPAGIHLEGPCINRLRNGVHPIPAIQNPSLEFFERIHTAARGTLRLITIAPELPGALELIRVAVAQGVTVSIGHSDGSAEDARLAIVAGATHVTHTFNAMRPMLHREPGLAGEALTNPALTAEIIADGVHVDPLMVRIFLTARGAERAVLVTDAISATGMGDGSFRLGTFEVNVRGSRVEFEGRLAGSVLTLDQAVRNVMHFAGWPLAESVRLASSNPAAVLGERTLGRLCTGARADIAVLTADGVPVANFIAGRPAQG